MFLVVVLCYWYAKYAVNLISYCSNLITLVWRVTSVCIVRRPSTLLAKPESQKQSQVSRPIPHLCCWHMERGLSWLQRSTSQSPPSWRALSSYARIPTMNPKPPPLPPCKQKKARAHWHFSLRGESTLHGSWQLLYLATKKRAGQAYSSLCLLNLLLCDPAPAVIKNG